ncbi:MAG: J domain-containing protein [Epsilonproteobacteria bacterium]|nr:J domain-containing protein [Campylobacterota bacterium]
MQKNNILVIKEALKVLELPTFISLQELKDRYRILAKKNHPDFGGSEEAIIKINEAYKFLKNYMLNFRFSFSKEEIYKQFPQDEYASKFRF